jgi:prevent-host-death family protein
MSKYVTATKARKMFFRLLDEAKTPGVPVTITVDGLPKVVMMSAEEYEGWLETLEIMSDPDLVAAIREGMEDIKKGRTISYSQLRKELSRKQRKR